MYVYVMYYGMVCECSYMYAKRALMVHFLVQVSLYCVSVQHQKIPIIMVIISAKKFQGNKWCYSQNYAHMFLQSTLRRPEVHIHAIHFNVNVRFVWRLWGINDMHTVHVVLKIVHVYVWR